MTRGRYRSTFDVQLTQSGTYRIVNASSGLTARYELTGENRNWRGPAAEFATAPAKLTFEQLVELVRSEMGDGESLLQAVARITGQRERVALGFFP